jgi:hypothetical protein
MNMAEWLNIWRRRWILTAFALLVALLGCGVVALKLPRTYQATSTVVLVPSARSSRVLGDGNPYLSFTNSLATAADIMATELTAPATERNLALRGFSEPYTAEPESMTTQVTASGTALPGPFVAVTVTGSSKESVERTLHGVMDAIGTTLGAMQASLSPGNRIVSSTLSLTPRATLSVSKVARPLILIAGFLIVFALCVPLMVDAQIARRRIGGRDAPRRIPAQQARRNAVARGQRSSHVAD